MPYIIESVFCDLNDLKILDVFFDGLDKIVSLFFNFTPGPSFLSDVAVFEGVLIGVAIPISLQVVTRAADRYKDYEIAQFFTKEPLYKLQYVLLLPNIALAIFLKFLSISNPVVLWTIFFWFIVNIIVFYIFVKIVEEYTINTDKLLLGKLKRHVKIILEK
ncbi:hypothetical protein KAI68_06885 [bacterium]|nr:hypothetical protein [bacterium]